MATNTMFMTPGDNVEFELQNEITELCKTGVNKRGKYAYNMDYETTTIGITFCWPFYWGLSDIVVSHCNFFL